MSEAERSRVRATETGALVGSGRAFRPDYLRHFSHIQDQATWLDWSAPASSDPAEPARNCIDARQMINSYH
jgi:hypothetical protein